MNCPEMFVNCAIPKGFYIPGHFSTINISLLTQLLINLTYWVNPIVMRCLYQEIQAPN